MAEAAPIAYGIPLYCSICPKMPHFSDVSHLLTHVAAKGHLSHLFRVSIRMSTDEAAQHQLEQYHDWYRAHGIEGLLTKRMDKKDVKMGKIRRWPALVSEVHDVHNMPLHHQILFSPPDARSALQQLTADNVDPRLILSDLERRHDSRASHSPSDTTPVSTSGIPRLYLWPTSMKPASSDDACSDDPSITLGSEHCQDRLTSMTAENALTRFPVSSERGGASPESVGRIAGELHLKGVYWPGMSLFDSANPEMKRKRNQKKDGSLAAQLEIASARVTATEQMFDRGGVLQRERPISRLLEDSPIKKGKGQGKKRRDLVKKEKAPLSQSPGNVAYSTRSATSKQRADQRNQRMFSENTRFLRRRKASAASVYSDPGYNALTLGSDVEIEDHLQSTCASPIKREQRLTIFRDPISSSKAAKKRKKLSRPTPLNRILTLRSPLSRRDSVHSNITLLNQPFLFHASHDRADPFLDQRGPKLGDDAPTQRARAAHTGQENTNNAKQGISAVFAPHWKPWEKDSRFYSVEDSHRPLFVPSMPYDLPYDIGHHLATSDGGSVYGFTGNPLAPDLHCHQYAHPFGLDGAWSPRSSGDRVGVVPTEYMHNLDTYLPEVTAKDNDDFAEEMSSVLI